MRVSRDLLRRLRPTGHQRLRTVASCGALLLLLGACGSTANSQDGEDEATGGSTGNGGAPQTGGADNSGGADAGGAGGVGGSSDGGATGGTTTGGGTAGVGASATGGAGGGPTGGSGGEPTGGSGGDSTGGGGGNPTAGTGASTTGGVGASTTGGVGGNPTGGNGGEPTGGSGGDPTGGGGGDPTGGGAGEPTGGVGGNPTGGSGGEPTGGSGGGSAGGAGTGGGGPCDDPGTIHSGGTDYCEGFGSGDVGNGYHYSFWTNTSGSGCMTVFEDDATFKCDWSDPGDFLCGVGLTYDETQTPDEIGTFSSEFAITGSASAVAFLGIHGWTVDPWVEFYIMENWVNEPEGSPPAYGGFVDTITVDGGTYAVYHGTMGDGSHPTHQYYSIRTEGRQCGYISISEHFSQWASLGLELGQLSEVMLFAEGLSPGSGDYEFTRATVTVQ